MTIWEQWGHELGSMPLDHWRGNQADETLRAKLAQYFHRELTAAKWAAGKLAGIDPEAAEAEALDLLLAGLRAGQARRRL